MKLRPKIINNDVSECSIVLGVRYTHACRFPGRRDRLTIPSCHARRDHWSAGRASNPLPSPSKSVVQTVELPGLDRAVGCNPTARWHRTQHIRGMSIFEFANNSKTSQKLFAFGLPPPRTSTAPQTPRLTFASPPRIPRFQGCFGFSKWLAAGLSLTLGVARTII